MEPLPTRSFANILTSVCKLQDAIKHAPLATADPLFHSAPASYVWFKDPTSCQKLDRPDKQRNHNRHNNDCRHSLGPTQPNVHPNAAKGLLVFAGDKKDA